MKREHFDKRKRKEQGEGDGRKRHGKHREKREGEEESGGFWPLFHDFVRAITPFVCICSPFISEKPPPRGCRHCWPNHVKYCVCYNAFSPSNLRLIGLSHPIGLPSCPNPLLKRFRTYPFATRAFFDVTDLLIDQSKM
jgi:hypothetical protein